MMKKSNLDERQELILLKIEHNSCWLAFWGLLAAIMVQHVVYGPDLRSMAGEWIVFMVMSVYMVAGCLKNGIWDRRIRPSAASNLIASLIAGVIVGFLMFLSIHRRFQTAIAGSAAAGVITGVSVFFLCFLVLTVTMRAYRKRRDALEAEPEDKDE